MAIQKSITLSTGDTGEYHVITFVSLDIANKHVSAHFSLYKNAAVRANVGVTPQRAIIAKLRLSGSTFDKYLSGAAVSTSSNHIRQLYLAARAEPGCVVSDYNTADNPLFGSDAVDV